MTPAALLLVGLLVAAMAVGAPHDPGAAERPLSVLAGLQPADALGSVAAGWGDAWMEDRRRDRLLRVDGTTGRIVAEIPVDGRVSLAAGAGAMWALQASGGYAGERRGPLLRIDPATNRVTARIPLLNPAGDAILGFGVIARGDALLVWGPRDVLWIDPAAARVVGAIEIGEARGELTGMVLRGSELVATTADGHLVRLDARTGRETGAVALPLAGGDLAPAGDGRLVMTARGVLAGLDPAGGRELWRRRLGFRIGGVAEAGGVLWAHGSAFGDPGDRLWALDPRSGRVLHRALLPAFGTMDIAAVGGSLWITTPRGSVFVAPRWLVRLLA